ncbi:MAG: DNA replication/repair protein RecF [Firmicutes bacterium]|nr:DNA replication/repair protein RecF [Bacillota bacterium]
MHVKSIRLINFRNYNNLRIKLNKKLNIFLGNNAQGKTNLLESINISSLGKSFRTNKDKELINIDKGEAYIGLEVEKKDFNKLIEIKLEKNKAKRVKINRVELEKISEMIGVLNVVIFSPEDLKIIKFGPGERRNFLDTEISQLKPIYRYNLGKYNKILYQRNNLLKNIQYDKNKIKLIDVWDEQLTNIGSNIIINRLSFLENISNISKKIHKNITGDLETLNLNYLNSFPIKDIIDSENNIKSLKNDIKNRFFDILKKNLNKDIEKGTTQIGPHRDDIEILINKKDARIFGSQGQQRTAALSLKLAEVELINNEIGEYPVLLLDDVLSELDVNRRKYLISTFKDIQTIITSTDDIDLTEIKDLNKSIFCIEQGIVKKA